MRDHRIDFIKRWKFNNGSLLPDFRPITIQENKVQALKNAIQEGIDSGVNEDFDVDEISK